MTSSIDIKKAPTVHEVDKLLTKRWSARSFSEQTVSQENLDTILEGATWAASANNEQPWVYYYGFKGTAGFDKILDSLVVGNQLWAKNASVLVASVARTTFQASEKPNPSAFHDVGMANAQLLLQAVALDIYGHPMGGYDKVKLAANIALPKLQEPVIVIALGYLDEADKLEEPFKTREVTPRQRKPLDSISHKL